MKLDFDDAPIEIPCPSCGEKLANTLGGLKRQPNITCSCGANTTVDLTKFDQGVSAAQKALDDFEASLSKLGKR